MADTDMFLKIEGHYIHLKKSHKHNFFHTKNCNNYRRKDIGKIEKTSLARDGNFSCVFSGKLFIVSDTQGIFFPYLFNIKKQLIYFNNTRSKLCIKTIVTYSGSLIIISNR